MLGLLPDQGGLLARLCALGVATLVTVLSLMPNVSMPDGAPGHTDLAVHLIMQGTLGVALVRAWPRHLPYVALVLAALVVGLEVGQIWVPGREFSKADLLFNVLGGSLGVLLGVWIGGPK